MSGRRVGSLILIGMLLCGSVALAEGEPSSVQGVADMAMINGIALTDAEGETYRFVITGQTDHPDAASIGAGRAVIVTFAGPYRDGKEALTIALAGAAEGSLAAPASPYAGLPSVSGTITGLDGTLLTLLADDNAVYTFDISGAAVEGDESAGVGDSAQVWYTDGDEKAVAGVAFTLSASQEDENGLAVLAGSRDPALVNQNAEDTETTKLTLDDSELVESEPDTEGASDEEEDASSEEQSDTQPAQQ